MIGRESWLSSTTAAARDCSPRSIEPEQARAVLVDQLQHLAAARATQVSGSSATTTGRPVSSMSSLSTSRSSAPPVSTMPRSATSDRVRAGLLERGLDRADDALQRLLQRLEDLVGIEREAARHAFGEVAALHGDLAHLLARVGRAISIFMRSAVASPIRMP